jgi:hypothetical protein
VEAEDFGGCVAGGNSSQAAEILVVSSTEEQGKQRSFGFVRQGNGSLVPQSFSPRKAGLVMQIQNYGDPNGRGREREPFSGPQLPLLAPSFSGSFAEILTPPHNPKFPLFLCVLCSSVLLSTRISAACDELSPASQTPKSSVSPVSSVSCFWLRPCRAVFQRFSWQPVTLSFKITEVQR